MRPLALRAIRVYQLARGARPSPCRFVPSCSEYAAQSFERFGVWRATWLSLKRVGRCHPWGEHGYDPVPEDRRVLLSRADGALQSVRVDRAREHQVVGR